MLSYTEQALHNTPVQNPSQYSSNGALLKLHYYYYCIYKHVMDITVYIIFTISFYIAVIKFPIWIRVYIHTLPTENKPSKQP